MPNLNLPKEIKFETIGTIEYIYACPPFFWWDGEGNKLKKRVIEGTSNKTIDYLNTSTPLSTGGLQYEGELLSFFPTAEGYPPRRTSVKAVSLASLEYSYQYVYNYIDHTSTSLSTGLGNIRLKYTEDPQTGETTILVEDHYYPYGLKHIGYNSKHLVFEPTSGGGLILSEETPLV